MYLFLQIYRHLNTHENDFYLLNFSATAYPRAGPIGVCTMYVDGGYNTRELRESGTSLDNILSANQNNNFRFIFHHLSDNCMLCWVCSGPRAQRLREQK